ncbi:MAG: DUF4388 domain-containing protein [Candidatus Melainabacteria bacterium]|nr:DUF4388 domain-containing protein [Candidatus Melainabacteria bacterium]
MKLPQLWNVPSLEHVVSMLQSAQKEANKIIEQYWSVEGQDRLLILTVTCDESGDPLWTLSESKITDTQALWEHRTSDTALIHTLILGESTGEVTASVSKNTSDFSTSISLRFENEARPDAKTENAKTTTSTHLAFENSEDAILQGDVRKVQLANVVQSIQMGKMTGRLAVRSEGTGVDIYFDDGEPVHATDGIDRGDEVLMDLICLTSGKFQFMQDERTTDRTVTRPLEALLMEAISLVDQSNFLEKEGFSRDAYLIPRNAAIDETELMSILSRGIPIDQNMQRQFLRSIGEFKQFTDVMRVKPLKRSEFVPVLFNLVTLNLLRISDKPPQIVGQGPALEEHAIDYRALEATLKPIMRPETGILTYPAFQFFLAQECYRYELCGIPASLVVFSIRKIASEEPIVNLDVRDLMAAIASIKRPIDMLGHFQTFDYGIILPNTGTRSAAVFCQRVQDTVVSSEFSSGMKGSEVVLSFGIAGIPENCSSMGQLLPAADQAKKAAETSSSHLVLFQSR